MTPKQKRKIRASYMRKWRALNPEKARFYEERWRLNNMGKRRVMGLRSYYKHRTKRLKYAATWRERTRVTRLQKKRKWYALNKHVWRLYRHDRMAREKSKDSTFRIKKSDIIELQNIQNRKCVYCQTLIAHKFEIDHIVSLASGGEHCRSNIQLTCFRCNRSKGAKTESEFLKNPWWKNTT